MAENARTSTTLTSVRTWINTPSFILAFQVTTGVYSAHAASQFHAAFCTLRYCLSYLFIPARFNINSLYQCTAITIPVLTTLLQIKYQGTDQNSSPFTTNPTTMRVAVSSCVVYYLALVALLRSSRRHFAIAAHLCLTCSGYASVASLTSLLFSDSARVYVYSIFVLISAAELLYYYKRVAEYLLYQYYTRVAEEVEDVGFEACTSRIGCFINNLCRIPNGQRPHILPI